MEERRVLKVVEFIVEVNDQIYEGRDNKIIVTTREDGNIRLSASDALYDMLTEPERRRIEALAEELFTEI